MKDLQIFKNYSKRITLKSIMKIVTVSLFLLFSSVSGQAQISKLKKSIDKFSETEFYYHPKSKSNTFFYMSYIDLIIYKNKNGITELKMRINYIGTKWIFFDNMTFKAYGYFFEFPAEPSRSTFTLVHSVYVKEIEYLTIENTEWLVSFINDEGSVLRISGSDGVIDLKPSKKDRKCYKEVLNAYMELSDLPNIY